MGVVWEKMGEKREEEVRLESEQRQEQEQEQEQWSSPSPQQQMGLLRRCKCKAEHRQRWQQVIAQKHGVGEQDPGPCLGSTGRISSGRRARARGEGEGEARARAVRDTPFPSAVSNQAIEQGVVLDQ
ncbi:hypothetical protein CKAH01_03087 [Colletotrichum kahawae]|uniref:Uncharacterized protein n=1 Tax=Colletotrichum kahawae TaxID=34407 RepID=A0AAD9YTZ9_COLKA|nr:hypothetical protein CKAH01_03087 [Colletotrichum kahawae]